MRSDLATGETVVSTPTGTRRDWSATLARVSVLCVAALALGLRLYRAGAQSYWYDEGISVSLAGRSLIQITRDALADIHPPVYYYVLHFWTQLSGDGEFAVRFVSGASAAFAVCCVYALGSRLFSRWTGVVAAAFTATAPVLVYYGQEARMYSLLLALTTLWSLVLLKLLSSEGAGNGEGRRWLWAAYVGLGVLSLYTHYFAALLLGVHALWSFTLYARRPRLLAVLTLAMAGVALLFVPWFLNMGWTQLSTFQQGQKILPPGETLVKMLDDFTFGHRVVADESQRPWYVALLLTGIVGALALGTRARTGLAFAVLYLGVPVAAMLALNSTRSAYAARLMILASPGLYLIFGQGVVSVGGALSGALGKRLGGPVGFVAGLGLLLVALVPLNNTLQLLYFHQSWMRDDYRGAVRHVEANARPDDAIVLDSPYQGDIVNLYFSGSQTQYPLPIGVPADRDKTEAMLAEILGKHGGVWAILWGTAETDPQGIVERYLDGHAFKALDSWFGGVRLAHYTVARVGERVPLDVRFGDAIRLRGYAWQKTEGIPGDVLPLTLFWETSTPLDKRYKVFVHLLDDDEKIWGQRDSEPAGGAKPTVDWKPGVEVEDRIGLPVDANAAPGTYQVEIGLYDYPSMERPNVVDSDGRQLGNRLLVGEVTVR